MKKLELLLHNTYFVLRNVDRSLYDVIEIMKNKFQSYEYKYDVLTRRTYRALDKCYYTYDKNRDSYRFTINILKEFILLLKSKGLTEHDIKLVGCRHYLYRKVQLTLHKDFKLRDYQIKYNARIKEDGTFKFVELQAGRGKSLIAMSAIADMGICCGMLLLPKYIDKWIIDIKKYTNVTDEEIYIIQGMDSITYLINHPEKQYKFILMSLRSIGNYIKDYEDNGTEFIVNPDQICQKLGIGVILSDETHQEFHAIFKAMLYLNPMKMIGLSATFHSNNKETEKFYHYLFPTESRIEGIIEIKKIANCYAVSYNMKFSKKVKYQGPQGYNHTLYEQSIMRNPMLMRDYTNMIMSYVRKDYIPRRKTGQKALIFGATIKFCTILYNYFKKAYPKLVVARYVAEDSFDEMLQADIIISTNGSAGTAIDIPGLITVVQSVSMSTSQGNEQNIGRLREIEGVECNYFYLYCHDIDKHRKHSNDRLEAVRKVCKNVYFERYGEMLRSY